MDGSAAAASLVPTDSPRNTQKTHIRFHPRRRKMLSTTAPKPANASTLGSGMVKISKLIQPTVSGTGIGTSGGYGPNGCERNSPDLPLTVALAKSAPLRTSHTRTSNCASEPGDTPGIGRFASGIVNPPGSTFPAAVRN